MKQNVESKINELLVTGYKTSFNSVFGKASDIFKGIAGYAILAFVVYFIASMIISSVIGLLFPVAAMDYNEVMDTIQGGDNEALRDLLTQYSQNTSYIYSIVNNLITAALYPILYSIFTMAYKFDNYKNVEISDIFIHYRDGKFLNIFFASLIISIISMIGIILCIIPGFIIYAVTLLVVPLIIFADADIKQALNYGVKLGFKDLGSFILLLLSIIGVLIVGLLLCCVGLIAAVPFVYVLIYSFYKEIVGFPDNHTEIDEIGTDIYKDNPYMNS